MLFLAAILQALLIEKEKQGGWVLFKLRKSICSVSQLGDATAINADVFQKIEKLFCHLYEMPNDTNINETYYSKLCME